MIYVMSDIHGCDSRYRNILKQIKLKSDDHLYILGDVIDRGPNGLGILRETMKKENITLLIMPFFAFLVAFFIWNTRRH